jgi:hypothetical protein
MRPLCRHCGGFIPKRIESYYLCVGGDGWRGPGNAINIPSRIRSMAECQKLTDQKVISVRYHTERNYVDNRLDDRYIYSFNAWDRKTYVDQYFCCQNHAVQFAYAVVQGS